MLNKIISQLPKGMQLTNTQCSVAFEQTVTVPVDPDILKEQVEYYRLVMKDIFQIPNTAFFPAVPVRMADLKKFVDDNATADGVRIYFAKRTPNPSLDDYEIILISCQLITESGGQVVYYEDIGVKTPTPPGEREAATVTFECRKPPGCGKGALLLKPDPA